MKGGGKVGEDVVGERVLIKRLVESGGLVSICSGR